MAPDLDGETQKTTLSSNGKLVNLGNADRNGVNVNNDNPDNRNDNLGVVSLRSHSHREKTNGHLSVRFACARDPPA